MEDEGSGIMAKDFLKNLIAKSGNEHASVVADGIPSSDIKEYYSTGSYAFNALLSGDIHGGIPNNKIVAIAGEQATGKTFFCLSVVKTFLEEYEKGVVFYFDSESAVSKEMFEDRGLDITRIVHLPVATVEAFRNQAIKIVDEITTEADRPKCLFVLDSIGNLSSAKEMADTAEGKDTKDMTRAQVVKATFRVLTIRLGVAGIPLLVTAHTYSSMGSMYPTKVMSSGSGLQYCASIIIFLSKRKDKDDKTNEVVGNFIRCKLDKSRLTKENSQVEINLDYETGIDPYSGLTAIALKREIFTKDGNKIVLPDGRRLFESAIDKDPEKVYTEEVLAKINEACKAEFCYGKVELA